MKHIVSAVAAAFCMSTAVSAAPLAVDTGWQKFKFWDVGSSLDRSFDFVVPVGMTYTFAVADAFNSGDRFEFFVNGVSAGQTSDPTTVNASENDPDVTFGDPRFSSGILELSEGSYEITGVATQSPFGGGGAFAQLTSTTLDGPMIGGETLDGEVPVPASLPLLLAGIGGLAALRRRK